MTRFAWFVLLCACHSSTAVAPSAESGGEAPESADPEETPSGLVLGAGEVLYYAENIEARQRYMANEDQREAYGDGEDCEGVCGLSVPSIPEPEPLSPADLDMLADTFEEMARSARTQTGAHWTVLAARLVELANAARVEGELAERMDEAVFGALQALEIATASDAPSDELCRVGMRLVAADLISLAAALLDASNELQLQIQIDYGMDEPNASSTEEEADALYALFEQTDPVIDRAAEGLAEEPPRIRAVMTELETLMSLIEPALGARIIEGVRGSSSRLPVICPNP